jgi:hypothetical protein
VPKRPREEDVDAVHHVVAQGNGRTRIVLDDSDRKAFSRRFASTAEDCSWSSIRTA